MPPTSADTATAPRIRQYEQVQRRAVLSPSVNFTRKRTVPQWHAASISPGSFTCTRQAPELCRRFRCDAFDIQRLSERFTMPQNIDHIRHSPAVENDLCNKISQQRTHAVQRPPEGALANYSITDRIQNT